MKRLHINPETCTGCRLCEVYCSLVHEEQVNPTLSRIKVWKDEQAGIFLPIACTLCEEKACVRVCPEPGAITFTSSGSVIIAETLCTGCSKCVAACDILAITLHVIPGRGKHGKAVVVKCDMCAGDPWCVKVCEPGSLTVIDDQSSGEELYRLLADRVKSLEAERTRKGFKSPRRSK